MSSNKTKPRFSFWLLSQVSTATFTFSCSISLCSLLVSIAWHIHENLHNLNSAKTPTFNLSSKATKANKWMFGGKTNNIVSSDPDWIRVETTNRWHLYTTALKTLTGLLHYWSSIPSIQFEHYWKTTISATLIEVYEEPHTSDKRSLLIAIKFKAMSLSLFSSNVLVENGHILTGLVTPPDITLRSIISIIPLRD